MHNVARSGWPLSHRNSKPSEHQQRIARVYAHATIMPSQVSPHTRPMQQQLVLAHHAVAPFVIDARHTGHLATAPQQCPDSPVAVARQTCHMRSDFIEQARVVGYTRAFPFIVVIAATFASYGAYTSVFARRRVSRQRAVDALEAQSDGHRRHGRTWCARHARRSSTRSSSNCPITTTRRSASEACGSRAASGNESPSHARSRVS